MMGYAYVKSLAAFLSCFAIVVPALGASHVLPIIDAHSQFDASDAGALLAAHPNLVFLTSHANTLVANESRQPWTNMFADRELTPEWKALLVQHPDRFVLALDNVWPEHWSEKYVQQVDLWREALGKLPAAVAHAVAHGNAERLWKLAPAMVGQGCGALKHPPSQ